MSEPTPLLLPTPIEAPIECRECGSRLLSWEAVPPIRDAVCDFALGCDECSATVAVVPADRIADFLTRTKQFRAGLAVCTCGAREFDGCFCNLTIREFLNSPGDRRV